MAEAKTSTINYLSGEDPDTLEANRRYQDALAKLTSSLDNRKNRFFDPTMLAMAEGFLSPTQTGGFGESLGKVAGKLGPAEAAALKEEQELAQQNYAEQAAQEERQYRQNVYRNKVESMANVGYQIPNTQENTSEYFKGADGKVDSDRLSLWKAHVEYVVNNDKSLDDKLSAVPKEQLNNIDFVTSYVVAHAWQSFQKVVGKPAKVQNLTEQSKVQTTSTQGVGKVLPDSPLGRANTFNQRLDPQTTTQDPRSFASFVQKAQGT